MPFVHAVLGTHCVISLGVWSFLLGVRTSKRIGSLFSLDTLRKCNTRLNCALCDVFALHFAFMLGQEVYACADS